MNRSLIPVVSARRTLEKRPRSIVKWAYREADDCCEKTTQLLGLREAANEQRRQTSRPGARDYRTRVRVRGRAARFDSEVNRPNLTGLFSRSFSGSRARHSRFLALGPIWLFLVFAALLAAPLRGHAGSCSRGWVCVEPRELEDEVEFFAKNLQPYPLTLTLEADGRNLLASGENPVTMTVPGLTRIKVMQLRAVDPNEAKRFRYYFDWTPGSLDPDHDDAYLYRLPYARDERYSVLQGFDSSFSHQDRERYAVDFKMPIGTAVHAAREGIVVMTTHEHDRSCMERRCGRYANYIVILHDDGTTGEYYHLRKGGVMVHPGEYVRRGQPIGRSGDTGRSTMPHLHFAVYRAVDWGRTQSIRIRFLAEDGVITLPVPGRRYGVED